jgi:hypothetical protein
LATRANPAIPTSEICGLDPEHFVACRADQGGARRSGDQWGAKRKVEFRESFLNEWIKQGLVVDDDRDRGDNERTRPTYRYGRRYYRRVLQVLRLYARGIRSVDQILILLFVGGHGVKPYEVREPLIREFARARAKLNAMARSHHLERSGNIPPKHKQSLARSLGEADKRFAEAGVAPNLDQTIAAIRAARSPDPESNLRRLSNARDSDPVVERLKVAMGGFLAVVPDVRGEVERTIIIATDADLWLVNDMIALARRFLGWMKRNNPSPHAAGFIDAILISFTQPEFVTSEFAVLLTLLRRFFPSRGDRWKNSFNSQFGDSHERVLGVGFDVIISQRRKIGQNPNETSAHFTRNCSDECARQFEFRRFGLARP